MNKNQSRRKPFVIHHCMSIASSRFNSLNRLFEIFGGNTGNMYITYSLIKGLYQWNCDFRGIQNIWQYDYSNQDEDIDYINTEASEVFINLTDFIRVKEQEFPGINIPLLTSFLKRIKKQVYVIGIGANALHGAEKEFIENLSQEMKFFLHTLSAGTNLIGVRGAFTEEMLYNAGIKNVAAIGCPTFYENGEYQSIQKSSDVLYDNDIVFTSYYGMQKHIGNAPVILQGCPEERQIEEALKNRYSQFKIFSSIPEWKKFLSNYKFAVGMRVHGGIAALNSGVPAVILNRDKRAQEMIDFLKMPRVAYTEDLNFSSIYNPISFNEYNKNYRTIFDKYIGFLKKNGLEYENFSENVTLFDTNIRQENSSEIRKLSVQINQLQAQVQALNKKRTRKIFDIAHNQKHTVVKIFGVKMKFKPIRCKNLAAWCKSVIDKIDITGGVEAIGKIKNSFLGLGFRFEGAL